MFDLPAARTVERNPSAERLRELAFAHMPRLTETEYGNLNYEAEVTARLKNSTFFVADEEIHQNRISRAEANEWAAKQDAYIADKDMILIEGYIGPDPGFRTGSRLFMERTQANIPAMQQQLYFPKDENWEPEFTVVYTPGLPAPGKPMDRLVCGDVGFGKTEVAMRAAYKAAIDGFQVGVLVPTTILAQQHYNTFSGRFAEFPVNLQLIRVGLL